MELLDLIPSVREQYHMAPHDYLFDDQTVNIHEDFYGNTEIVTTDTMVPPRKDQTGVYRHISECVTIKPSTNVTIIDTPFGYCVEDSSGQYASDFYDTARDPCLIAEQIAVVEIERIIKAVQARYIDAANNIRHWGL